MRGRSRSGLRLWRDRGRSRYSRPTLRSSRHLSAVRDRCCRGGHFFGRARAVVLVVTVCVMSGAFLIPAWVMRRDEGAMLRAARALTVAGLAGAAGLVLVGLASAWLGERWCAGRTSASRALRSPCSHWCIRHRRVVPLRHRGGTLRRCVGTPHGVVGRASHARSDAYRVLLDHARSLADRHGYLYKSRGDGREVPAVTDLLGTSVGLGVPALLSLGSGG